MATTTKPRVVLVSLEFEAFFDSTYEPLIEKISAKARMQRAKTPGAATRLLNDDPAPQAVLITDGGVANQPRFAPVWDAILAYVRSGGVAVIMGHFPTFTRPNTIKPLFAKAGLPWASGSYHRTTTTLNANATGVGAELAAKLPEKYSQKALNLDNVAAGDAWYASTPDSRIESHVFPPTNAHTVGEAASALATVGGGKLGYLGDVNNEEGSVDVVLAMCGLL
ncbi:Ribonuclease H-like protein [Mycena kentingensis (nom. inval.)]|nr:Ribonuclease H-like protein [Mycena kentingensis (nom. inval.)]